MLDRDATLMVMVSSPTEDWQSFHVLHFSDVQIYWVPNRGGPTPEMQDPGVPTLFVDHNPEPSEESDWDKMVESRHFDLCRIWEPDTKKDPDLLWDPDHWQKDPDPTFRIPSGLKDPDPKSRESDSAQL